MMKPMSLQARREMLLSIQEQYKKSDWASKNKLLDGFVAATGYERKYAIRLLCTYNPKELDTAKPRTRHRQYDDAVIQVLVMIWHASNQICSKRLVPFLPDFVAALEKHGHLCLSEEIKARVLSVSPATFDRLLRKERIKVNGGLSTTTPGRLLKNQIKIRTFADWNEKRPGFFEADLVAHCGETVSGIFLNTLVITDIVTTWTECIPLLRKSADDVILGLDTASKLLPFSILGFDVDNGCEFINHDVFAYCETHKITFTRSRPYRKNDQAHVEEKNGSIVRRLIGYDRYEGEAAWAVLAEIYALLRLYINFFQPSLKLLSKTRNGSKTVKKYDKAKTPFQRVILNDYISSTIKQELTQQYNKLDPITLQNRIKSLQHKLGALAWKGDIIRVAEHEKTNAEEMVLPAQPFYRKTKKPRKIPTERHWRTRKDPFADVNDFIMLELQLNQHSSATELLTKLMEKYPTQFTKKHLRTLQRRVQAIRNEQDEREKRYETLMINKKSLTTDSLSAIITT